MSHPHDEDELPDPMELFRRMQGEQTVEVSGDDFLQSLERARRQEQEQEAAEELPDPMELYRQMSTPSEPDSGSTLEVDLALRKKVRETRQEPAAEREELPDPAELFARMQREQAEVASETPAPAIDIPMPSETHPSSDTLEGKGGGFFRRLKSRFSRGDSVSESSELEEPSRPTSNPGLPTPEELFRQYHAEDEEKSAVSLEELDLPMPGDAPQRVISIDLEPDEEENAGFFHRLKSRFKKTDSSLPEHLPQEEEPSALPSPEELFQRYREEAEPSSGESLPSPEELFQRIQQEEAEAEASGGGELPELPDLEAFKAQLEAEERERLDPDLESDLSGPERFVPTVSDSMFSSSADLSFFEDASWGEESEAGEKTLPKPEAWNVPTPEPWEPQTEPESAAPLTPKPQPISEPEPEPLRESPPSQRSSPTGTVAVNPSQSEPSPAASAPSYQPSRRARDDDDTVMVRPASRRKKTGTREAKDSSKEAAKAGPRFKRFSRYKLAIFTRQMAVMLRSGIQLHSSISFAAESDPEMRPLLNDVVQKVESGYSFSNAVASASRSFDPVYVGLIQAGELSGRLPEMLARLANVLEREVEIRKKIISTITYPAVLFLVCLLGTLGFIFFVLPTLTPLFNDLGVNLPLPTRILLASRELILPTFGLLVTVLVVTFLGRDRISDYVKSRPTLERRISSVPFHLPVIGEVYEKVVTARVLYSLSTMLDVGITLNQALARAETTAGNALTAHRLGRARMDLADGVGVTDCFRMNELFNASALHLISAGEEAAKLAEMFQFVAKIFDEEVEYALQGATALLEPLIMVFMGLIVGFITISAALPTIQLLQNFS